MAEIYITQRLLNRLQALHANLWAMNPTGVVGVDNVEELVLIVTELIHAVDQLASDQQRSPREAEQRE